MRHDLSSGKEHEIRYDLQEVEYEGMDWIDLGQDKDR